MTGHQHILALRRRGYKPSVVWVVDDPENTCIDHDLTVRIEAHDTPELLDLRFLVGTTAVVDGDDDKRVDRLASACGAHAARVISNTFTRRGYRSELTRVTDTQGVFTWPN